MKTWIYIAFFVTAVCGDYKISKPDEIIKGLTEAGQVSLKQELQKGINESQVLQVAFNTANETCQKSLVSLIDNCRSCVKDQCYMRVKALNCSITADFNKTFDDGIKIIGERIDYFFRNTLPRFFTEDLNKFFGKDIPYFFENDFKDFFKNKVPSFFKNEFSNFFITDIPNFFKNDVTNFFQNDFTNFFKHDIKNFFEKDVKNFFEDAGKKIKDFFGRRRRRDVDVASTSEATSCENFAGESNVQKYCYFYIQNCTECLPSQEERTKACPELAKAHNNMKQFGWIITAATTNGSVFEITSISNGDEEPKNGLYKKPVVELFILGKNTTIKMDEPINLSDKSEAAKKIVIKAIAFYKSNMNETTTL